MPLPVINFDPLLTAPAVRGIGWSLKRTEQWKTQDGGGTIRQGSPNGRTVKIPRFNNPLYLWELKWNYVNDGWPGGIQQLQPLNAPYTDFQVLRSLYFQAKGAGNEFYYQPIDAVISGQPIAAPDANNNSEVVKTVGGYQIPFSAGALTITNVVIQNNVLTITVSSITGLSVGMGVQFSGIGTATFLNGVSVGVTSIKSNTFSTPFTHANYPSAADTGTATIVSNMQPVYESVQALAAGSLTSVYVNGVSATNFNLSGPSTVSPYDGFVIQWNTSGGGSIPGPTDSIIANFTYYYQSEFEDSIDYENFLPYLWKVGSLKFQQVRL